MFLSRYLKHNQHYSGTCSKQPSKKWVTKAEPAKGVINIVSKVWGYVDVSKALARTCFQKLVINITKQTRL
jgi:hypothetical protein